MMADKDAEYDVFEELRQYDLSRANMADSRRFSFSVPADFDSLYDGCGRCGECAECLEGATSFTLEEYSDNYIKCSTDSYADYSNDIDNSNIFYSILKSDTNDPITKIISKGFELKQFKIPTIKAKDARDIWMKSGLDDISSFNDIQDKLINWVSSFAEIEHNDDINKTQITWRTETGCKCVSTWYNFIRWILCASISDTSTK